MGGPALVRETQAGPARRPARGLCGTVGECLAERLVEP